MSAQHATDSIVDKVMDLYKGRMKANKVVHIDIQTVEVTKAAAKQLAKEEDCDQLCPLGQTFERSGDLH